MELLGASGPSLHFLQQKSVSRRKCAACKIVVHTPCIEQLEKVRTGPQPLPPLPWVPKASQSAHVCVSTRMFT